MLCVFPFCTCASPNLGSNSTANMTVANSKAVAALASVHVFPQIVIFFYASL